jgi:hypothetical protein
MPETPENTYDRDRPDETRQLVLAGRLKKRGNGVCQLELVDGLTVDLLEEDCEHIEEQTDPVTLRATVRVRLKGSKPITATLQPHLYRVLAEARTMPFVFSGAAAIPPTDSVLGIAYLSSAPGGGGGATHHNTRMLCTNWMGTTQEDGTKGDSANEPDEIHLP